MSNIIFDIKFRISVLCTLVGFMLGFLTNDNNASDTIEMIMVLGFGTLFAIFGFSILPRIIFELSNPYMKLYLLCGRVGIAFVKLAIKVFIIDGKITSGEKAELYKYMQHEFGDEVIDPLLFYIDENKRLKEPINLICKPLQDVKVSGRIDILYQLCLLAAADKIYSDEEENLLKQITKGLRLGEKRFTEAKNTIFKEKGYKTKSQQDHDQKKQSWNFYRLDQLLHMAYNPFAILGLEQNASIDEVKHAYWNLAKQYHPDKAMQENEETKKQYAIKIIEINEAYESIKKMRAIK